MESSCKSIAKALVKKGILIENPIADGKKAYSAAVLAGDSAKIEAFKKDIREKQGTSAKLVSEGPAVATALSLLPALRLRYCPVPDDGKLPVVTMADFKKVMDVLKNKDADWHFYSVLALAKTDEEAQSFRTLIKNTIADSAYKNIAVIDALSTPLGLEAFEQYVDYSAMSMYYSGNNNQQSKENAKRPKMYWSVIGETVFTTGSSSSLHMQIRMEKKPPEQLLYKPFYRQSYSIGSSMFRTLPRV